MKRPSPEQLAQLNAPAPKARPSPEQLAQLNAPAPEKIGMVEAAVRKGGQGLLQGNLDEASAWLESKVPALGMSIGDITSGKAAPEAQSYEQRRTENRALQAKTSADQPIVSPVAEMGGGLVSQFSPAAKALKLGTVGTSALSGAANTFGNSETEDGAQLALETAGGGLLGAAAGKAGDWLGGKAQGLSQWLRGLGGEAQQSLPGMGTSAVKQVWQDAVKPALGVAARGYAGNKIGEAIGGDEGRTIGTLVGAGSSPQALQSIIRSPAAGRLAAQGVGAVASGIGKALPAMGQAAAQELSPEFVEWIRGKLTR